jgi:hypothetical protein
VIDPKVSAFARALFAHEHLSEAEQTEAEKAAMTALDKGTVRGGAEIVLSTFAGAAQGLSSRLAKALLGKDQKPATPSKAPTFKAGVENSQSLQMKLDRLGKKATSYLAITGIAAPPNEADVQALVAKVVARAKQNKAAPGFPSTQDLAKIASVTLGLNSGPDKIGEVWAEDVAATKQQKAHFALHAFDQRGFHVMWGQVHKQADGVLYIDGLRASHGRNCDDLPLDMGEGSVPGRGNGAITAAGLEAMITSGVEHGLHAIATSPGSPAVARLYEKMGFTAPGSKEPFHKKPIAWALENVPVVSDAIDTVNIARKGLAAQEQMAAGATEPQYDMLLDLTNPEAVRQALVAFKLSRSAAKDVPKNVSDRLLAAGQPAPQPLAAQYHAQFQQSAAVKA